MKKEINFMLDSSDSRKQYENMSNDDKFIFISSISKINETILLLQNQLLNLQDSINHMFEMVDREIPNNICNLINIYREVKNPYVNTIENINKNDLFIKADGSI
jgi:hypothetical protein